MTVMAYICLISSLPPTMMMVLTPSISYHIKNVLNNCYITYEALIYTDDRIFAHGPSDIKGRPGTTRGIIAYCSSFGPVETWHPKLYISRRLESTGLSYIPHLNWPPCYGAQFSLFIVF